VKTTAVDNLEKWAYAQIIPQLLGEASSADCRLGLDFGHMLGTFGTGHATPPAAGPFNPG